MQMAFTLPNRNETRTKNLNLDKSDKKVDGFKHFAKAWSLQQNTKYG